MKKIKTLFILFAVGALFVISEIGYIFNNSERLAYYSFYVAKLFVSVGKTDYAFLVLSKTTALISYRNLTTFGKDEKQTPSHTNGEFEVKMKDYISKLSYKDMRIKGNYYVANAYYNLGLLAYENGEKDLVPNLLKTSILLSPQFSYYEVELANFYLVEGKEELSKKVLDICQNYNLASSHCKEYADNNLFYKYPEPVGFLSQQVQTFK